MNQIRAWHGSAATLLVQARAIRDAIDASGGLRSIIQSLDSGEEVPNESGFAGAHKLTKQELSQLVSVMDDYVTVHDTDAVRRRFAKAKGPVAGL